MKIKTLTTKKTLFLILLLALVLRLPGLNANFTGDEIDTAGPARHFVINGDFRQMNDCNGNPYYNYTHPPVRLFLYSLWASIFGFSNMAIRLLPTLLGLASIVVIYLIGKELYSEKAGLIAALLAAISRYHVYGSNLVNTDTGHFIFTTSIAVLFFVMYLMRDKKKYLAASLIFSVIGMLTKFSTVIIFIPVLAVAYFYKKKAVGVSYVVAAVLISGILIFVTSLILNDAQVFRQPIEGFLTYSQGSAPTTQDYIMNKVFKLATISWQMTPFLALLLFLALYKLKKDGSFLILASWLVLGFLIIFLPYGQDTQRYFLMMLTPAFLLIARYLGEFKPTNLMIAATTIAVIFSAAIDLNDLMGYYQPIYLAIFYLAALAAVLHKNYGIPILFGGFVGLSIFFVFSGSAIGIGTDAVGGLSQKILDSGYPYKEVWTSKDIAYYITPQNETVQNCELILDKEFIKEKNISYIAFYSTVPRQNDMNDVLNYCSENYTLALHGYTVGFTCKIDLQKVGAV